MVFAGPGQNLVLGKQFEAVLGRSEFSLNIPEECMGMTDLERSLSKVLEDHRHESGLHIIGGQQRLIDRLVQFFEDGLKFGGRDEKTSGELDS